MPPECEKYLERVEHMLYCEQADKDRLLTGFRQEILETFPAASDLTEEQMIEHYGTPEAAAQELQAALPTSRVMRVFQRHKRRMWLGIVAAILAVVLVFSYIIWSNGMEIIYIDKKIVDTSK